MQLRRPRTLRIVLALVVLAGALAASWALFAGPRGDPERIWKEAEQDFLAGRYERAKAGLVRLKALRAPTAEDWMLQSQFAMREGKIDEALADLAHVSSDDPLGAQARFTAGKLELRRSRIAAAEKALVEALRLDPKLVAARKELIYIYGVQLRRRELNAQFKVLSDLTPLTFDNVFHWCLTRTSVWEPTEIIRLMKQFLEADPSDRSSRLALAESLRQTTQPAEAEQVLSVLDARDPKAIDIQARIALDRGDDQAAEALLAKGPPDDPDLAQLRGKIALVHRAGAAALRDFQIAYKADPDNRDALAGMAAALALTGDQAGAARFRDETSKRDRLGTLLQRAGNRANRRDIDLIRSLGAACESIQRLREARAWYQIAIALQPLDREAQRSLFRVNAAIAAETHPPKQAPQSL